MPQSITYTPFSVPILEILHFLVLGLSPETREKNYEKTYKKCLRFQKRNFYLLKRS